MPLPWTCGSASPCVLCRRAHAAPALPLPPIPALAPSEALSHPMGGPHVAGAQKDSMNLAYIPVCQARPRTVPARDDQPRQGAALGGAHEVWPRPRRARCGLATLQFDEAAPSVISPKFALLDREASHVNAPADVLDGWRKPVLLYQPRTERPATADGGCRRRRCEPANVRYLAIPTQPSKVRQWGPANRARHIPSPAARTVVDRSPSKLRFPSRARPLFPSVDTSTMWVMPSYEQDLGYGSGRSATSRVNACPGQPFDCKLPSLSDDLNRKARTARLRHRSRQSRGRLPRHMAATLGDLSAGSTEASSPFRRAAVIDSGGGQVCWSSRRSPL